MKEGDEEIPHIRDAPRRVQREHYRRERLMSVLASSVIVLIVGLMAYAIWRIMK
jgi:hypothetical protein